MAKATKARRGEGPPDPGDRRAFQAWLENQPREWSVVIAARAALRVLPLVHGAKNLSAILLPVFRATAIARLAGKYPNRAIERYADSAADSATDATAAARAATAAAYAAAAAARATVATAAVYVAAVRQDAQSLHERVVTPEQLAGHLLWTTPAPAEFGDAWQLLRLEMGELGRHWQVWIDWYEGFALHELHRGRREDEDIAFTDVAGELPWDNGAEAVNTEIARRLEALRAPGTEIPDQFPAPVRVEERDGKIAKETDRDSSLNASERDFNAWRDPVVDHIEELTSVDFPAGTNHSRVRDRLTKLGKLLPGEIDAVKENQFRIGYEIERFEGLMAAYRAGGEDMPALNSAPLKDLEKLRVALKMGIDKLERWSEFRKQANQSTAGEAEANREVVGEALDEMVAAMEQRPQYFDPELPASFRYLAEAVRDPSGATATVVYGAVRSAENLLSFLRRRALAIGKKNADDATHLSAEVAASLILRLNSAPLTLSRGLSHGWTWLWIGEFRTGCLLFSAGVAAGVLSVTLDNAALSVAGAFFLAIAGLLGLSLKGRHSERFG